MYGVILYSLIILFQGIKRAGGEFKKILKTAFTLFVVFFPGFIIDGNWNFFQEKLHIIPRSFNFIPLFYLFWNGFSVIYAAKYLLQGNEIQFSASEINPVFFEFYQISGQERKILFLALSGLGNKEIAKRIHISEGTVKNHMHHVYDKTGIKNRIGLSYLIKNFSI
jgi:hypothetical protein